MILQSTGPRVEEVVPQIPIKLLKLPRPLRRPALISNFPMTKRNRLLETPSAEDIDEWDSLNNVDLEMTLETECGIDFEVGEFEELKTVGEMIDMVEKKVN